jgi:beta-mannosidase
MKTVREFAGDGELFPDSPVMLHHERCSNGPEKLAQYLETEFGPATRDIERWVYRSQYVEAHCVGTALRHTRRRFPDCGGVLFWQHNDCWPVTSWSCIDHRCRPKALWYQARRDYAPAASSLADENGELSAWLCGNRAADLPAGRVRVRLLDFEGRARFEKLVDFPGADRGGSFRVWSAPRGEILGGDGQGLVLLADYLAGRKRVSRAVRTFVNCKNQPLGAPRISVGARPARKAGRHLVTLRSDRVALGVMLSAGGDSSGFSDNFLCLVPGEVETVESPVGEGLVVRHAGS